MKYVWSLLVLVSALTISAQANLLVNPGFDDPGVTFNSWLTDCDVTNWFGWSAQVSDSGYGVAPQSGDHALMLFTWDGGSDKCGVEQKPEVVAGVSYNLSMYYAIEFAGFTGTLTGTFRWLNTSGGLVSSNAAAINYTGYTAGQWNQVTLFDAAGIVAPAGAVRCEVNFEALNGGETMYIDTFDFAAVPEPVSATLFGLGIAAIGLIRRKIHKT